MDIRNGDVIQGPYWPEPVEVKLIEPMGAYVRLVGATTRSRTHVDQLLPAEEINKLTQERIQTSFTASPRHVFLALEAKRFRFASLYDPLLAMNISKIDPLPHQIEAVYGYALKWPRIRFLIADDPGAGKTIMAGLIIKELKLRNLARRILIVVPGHLKDQWKRELKEHFEESFVVIDRGVMDALYGENVWQREPQIITSIDFAKQKDVLPSLASTHFDLIVVDEAHKMAAYRYGNKLDKTERYKLGEVLSKATAHLLFLTATPHCGDPENFRLFLDLLEPGFFATTELLAASVRDRDNPLFIRRMKEDLKDFEGRPLFLPRHVKTMPFDLGRESPEEKELYNALSRYVEQQYNKALSSERRRNVAFALVILQRRLSSSTYALLRSLERRKRRLEELLQGAQEGRPDEQAFDYEAVEDLNEAERWRKEEIWETLSVAENRQELEREIATLNDLIARAQRIIASGKEVKLRRFQEALADLNRQHEGAKVLIFTESRDTMEHLQRCLRDWGYSVCSIHGGMDLRERVRMESVFKNEAQLLVATEAAGEGINLQFCNLMINYDIPWNPNRLEQRMGRIHRYGQSREAYIFNLVAADTREGQVFTRLFDKLEEIRAALGSDKVFDVLGDVMQGTNLAQLLVQAAANARSMDEILQELEIQVDETYLARVRDNLGESLASRYIDYTRIQEMADRAREHRLIPEYTEAFFIKAMETAGGRWRKRKTNGKAFLVVESVPYEWRQIAAEDAKGFGELLPRYPLVTFDKELATKTPEAEFVSFGHPLFEAALAWVERKMSDGLQRGATFTDPDGRLDGMLLFYEGEILDGLGQVAGRRLFALLADARSNEIRAVPPAILWDLEEKGEGIAATPLDLEQAKARAFNTLVGCLEGYRQELLQERKRQAEIKEKYGLTSLDYLIVKLDGELIELYNRRDRGENVDLVTRNKEEQKKSYEEAREMLKRNLAQETSLSLSTPRFLGALRVVPAANVSADMRSDSEVEAIGMRVAMDYERAHGRVPEDVSTQDLGFDIRSLDPTSGRKRYIEVKARADVGPVALTQNEWFKAQRFGDDYYLYAVLEAATRPALYLIRNPAAKLQPEERIEVRYWIGVQDIVAKGEKA